jgi:pyruvate formate lyase activating enzyme
MTTGVVLDVQRFSIHDGPGIRTTVFLKGCPLNCAWCHNPESRDPRPELALRVERCLACGACTAFCGRELAGPLRDGEHPGFLCERCGRCAAACPADARELAGTATTVDALLARLERDRPFYDASGGGVTFGGGEPLAAVNAPFVLEALVAAGERGLHRAVDTCGHVDPDVLRTAADRCELVLFDLKLADPERHRAETGVDNALVLRNLHELSAQGVELRLRVPLIPGRTDDTANLDGLADIVNGLPNRHVVHLLPYHALGRDKAGRFGLADRLGDVTPPTAAAVEAAAERLRARGLDVRLGG